MWFYPGTVKLRQPSCCWRRVTVIPTCWTASSAPPCTLQPEEATQRSSNCCCSTLRSTGYKFNTFFFFFFFLLLLQRNPVAAKCNFFFYWFVIIIIIIADLSFISIHILHNKVVNINHYVMILTPPPIAHRRPAEEIAVPSVRGEQTERVGGDCETSAASQQQTSESHSYTICYSFVWNNSLFRMLSR